MGRKRNVMVILAGGVGTRVGLSVPKQLVKIAGRPIMEHTIAVAQECELVDEIIVMMTPGYLDNVRAMVKKCSFTKVTTILEGAAERNGTTKLALDAIGDQDVNVIFHDAVRPLVSVRIIADVIAALDDHEAVDVAIPSADTIIVVSEDDSTQGKTSDLAKIREVPPRGYLRRGQTPQAFHLATIKKAYEVAQKDPDFKATDDCTVVLRYLPDVPIAVVLGDERNMKITQPIDVYLADKLFQLARNHDGLQHSPLQFSDKLAGKTVVVFGGSYGIGADIAALAAEYGATVKVFSRGLTNTHVNRRADLIKARDEVLADTGRIDYVVNTAGVLPMGALADASEETIYLATEVNYIAPMLIAQTFHDELAKTRGALLLFTSSSYTRGRGGYSLYSSAKAATVNLTQALADEWSHEGIRVNCVNPERTATPMRTNAFGSEPAADLLDSLEVARRSLDVLITNTTGHVIDVRKMDPLNVAVMDSPDVQDEFQMAEPVLEH
ncbi:SDR family NAD(P)-dependent oxidoreductase [Arthrobacter sp. NPDC058192]|uniref:SDR family NAD(P)-dependent oxidoreductase n=1 Tax=Arthrobacter sp. NPDC058192 TaxID=3346372 RepID=UPI0036E918DF